MKRFKAGDVVVCIDDDLIKKYEDVLVQVPVKGNEYRVLTLHAGINWEGQVTIYLELEGIKVNAFDEKYFEKKKQKSLTRQLAESFINSLVPERPEYERVFTLNADF